MATLGIDLGGTKIAAGILAGRELLSEVVVPTPRGAREVVAAMAAAGAEAVRASGQSVSQIGVGVPGLIDYQSGVVLISPNIAGLAGFNLAQGLQEAFALPVVLENDANVAALAEHYSGAAQGAVSSLYLTVSTGVGGGIVVDGQVLRGHKAQGGELGHITVLPGGPACGCGLEGCLEALASGRAIEREAAYVYKSPLTAAEVFARWQEGEATATRIVTSSARYVGIALASLQKVTDPEVIVLGGGVALNGGPAYREQIQASYQHYLSGWVPAEIRTALLHQGAGVIGAALAAELAQRTN